MVVAVSFCVSHWVFTILASFAMKFQSRILRCPYLILHDSLLKARPNHSFGSRLLAPAPRRFAIRRLRNSLLLPSDRIFYQRLVLASHCVHGQGIGAGHGRVSLLGVRVVGWNRVVGGSAVGSSHGNRSVGESRHEPAGASLQHCVGGGVEWKLEIQ